MGFLDSIKNRLPVGSGDGGRAYEDDYQEYDDGVYEDGEYTSYDARDGYSENGGDGYYAEDDGQATSGGAFERAQSYRNYDHAPLITMTDVRSQELPLYDDARVSARGSSRDSLRGGPRGNAWDSSQDGARRGTAGSGVERDAYSTADAQASYGYDTGRDSTRTGAGTGRASTRGRVTHAPTYSNYPDYGQREAVGDLAQSSRLTLSELHEERQRIENNPYYSVSQSEMQRGNDRVSAVTADRQAAAYSNNTRAPGGAGVQGANTAVRADTPSYYASRSGSATTRSAHSPHRPGVVRNLSIIVPTSYTDAEQVVNAIKAGAAVVINLTQVRAELAKRILDFSFGAAAALEAQVASPANRVYVITRGHELTIDEQNELKARGVLT